MLDKADNEKFVINEKFLILSDFDGKERPLNHLPPRPASTIFIATLRAVAGWRFFGVAYSLRINSDMLVVRVLKNRQLAGGESQVIYGKGHELLNLFLRSAGLVTGNSQVKWRQT